MGLLVIVDNPPRSQFCQVASEPGVGTAGAGEEEGVPERAGGEGEGPGEAELGAGGEALHAAEREPDAQTGTVRTSKITFSEAVVLTAYSVYHQSPKQQVRLSPVLAKLI